MSECIPQSDALLLQLAAIAGNEPAGGFLEIRYKRDTGGMGQSFHAPHRRKPLIEYIRGLAERTDVYVGCAPRRRRSGTESSIERVWALWADCDTPESVAALESFRPRPSLIVLSGSNTDGIDHRQAWWSLRWPLTPAEARDANRRLAQHLHADPRATDVARILRPAGTLNHKTDPPRRVVCEHVAITAYVAEQIVRGLPPVEQPARATDLGLLRTRRVDPSDDALRAIPATEYVPALTGRPVGRDGKTSCPFHGGGNERTPSLHVYPDDRGWTCFGSCPAPGGRDHLGGDIYVFGAALYGLDTRRDFPEIRRRLAADLLRAGEAAA